MKLSTAYIEITKTRNALILEGLGERIVDKLGRKNRKTGILITGSDGRMEKGYWSKPEPIIITAGKVEEVDNLRKTLYEIRKEAPELVADYEFEVKNLASAEIFSYAFDQKGRSYPQRIWDSKLVFGSPQILEISKDRIVEELRGREGSRIKSDVKDKKAEFRKAMECGKQRRKNEVVVNYDLETGRSFFGNIGNLETRSFKHGPLRFVQLVVVDILITAIREYTPENAIELVRNLPTPTDEKIDYLLERGRMKVDRETADAIKESYEFFLLGYHNSERKILESEDIVPFDIKEAKERIQFLTRTL